MNDKLKAQIEKEAKEYAAQFKYGEEYRELGYEDGATVWATKYEDIIKELQLAIDHRVDGRITSGHTEHLIRVLKEYNNLKSDKQ